MFNGTAATGRWARPIDRGQKVEEINGVVWVGRACVGMSSSVLWLEERGGGTQSAGRRLKKSTAWCGWGGPVWACPQVRCGSKKGGVPYSPPADG